ncbi:MAG: phosphoribosylformylglycinamidine synthase subunit PurS [Candidatus Zixiibacteriota bacterium]|nr:MAG: phosphoribosylformylglycinamidine synthase subunit PurS [candidate division Zixibacteria bacterium]HDL04749.1 phosphoribosylformylglycinamidine synthase subunit PurS [candidate division Zixibacteria bacterium]
MSNRKATVYVRLKDGVLDPQGVTIQRAILNMGYDMVSSVKSGRFFELEIDAEDGDVEARINEICGKLLANPVIENFQVEFEK